MSQIAGIRETEIRTGPGKGLAVIEVYNAAGLRFTVLPGRCLDIYDFSYKGVNLSFQTKNGLHAIYSPAEDEFFQLWPGGMLSTCGLANVGDACFDGGAHPIHGRIGGIPAHHVSVSKGWINDDYILSICGEMNETRLYGRDMILKRTISVGLFDKNITIEDTVTNRYCADEEFMLLYHFNFGYPLLDEISTVVCSGSNRQPRNGHSGEAAKMCAPGSEPPHQLFLYETSDLTRAALLNPGLGIGGYLEYDAENLPYLCLWKNPAPHDYVVALEPCNCVGLGRAAERENGTLAVLPAYGSITNRLKLGVLDGEGELRAFTDACR